jgi:hypothetical protein
MKVQFKGKRPAAFNFLYGPVNSQKLVYFVINQKSGQKNPPVCTDGQN